jgi:hypothetical protein
VLAAGTNLPVEFNLPNFATPELVDMVDSSPVDVLTLNENTIH